MKSLHKQCKPGISNGFYFLVVIGAFFNRSRRVQTTLSDFIKYGFKIVLWALVCERLS
jgi:hypothetical protein